MNISEPFIRRPAGTFLLAAGLFLAGLAAYRFLPVAPLPHVDYPVINVNASLPGADPETVASSLASPLERHLGQIAGVNEITSSSSLGSCSISLQFDLSRNVDGAARDVQAAIAAAASELPVSLPAPPTYRKVNPADAPIMVLAVTSDTREASQVFQYSDEIIGQRLAQIEGVSQVNVTGGEKQAVRVQINPSAIASAGLSLEDVHTFLSQVNVDQPKGSVDNADTSYTVETNDQLFEADQYKNLVLAQKNGTPILLGALGQVVDGVENNFLAGWAGTKPAVLIIIFKQPDANVIETVDRIKAALPQMEKWIPPSVKISQIADRTVTIRASVSEVEISMLISIALVVMVIFLFLRRFWSTFIASISVPLSLAGTFGGMYLLHYSLDNLSLMAVTISVGFVVDDAIVMIENVYRFIEQGDAPLEAALKGARQVGFTILSISISLVAVFIPLLFMSGLVGRLFHEFAVTLSMAIFVSCIVSLTLTPMMCSRFLKPEASYGPPGRFYHASETVFNWMLGIYETALRWVLRHQAIMLVVTACMIAATVWLYMIVPSGLFPQQDTGALSGTTDAAQDISFADMKQLQLKVAGIVEKDPAVEAFGSFVSSNGGRASNNGAMFITLKPIEERKVSADQVIARLRKQTAGVLGINLFLTANQDIRVGGRQSKAQYQYSLASGNLDELNQWAPKLMEKLKTIKELKDVNSDQQNRGLQMNVVVDRDAAARLGVTPQAVDATLYDAFGQEQVSVIYERYNQHHVILEVDPAYQHDPSSLDNIFVRSTTGKQVPLSAVSKFVPANAYLSITHQGQYPCVTLSFNLAPGVSLSQVTSLIEKAKRDVGMPGDILGSFQGTARVFQDTFASMPLLLFAALFTVYIVLGMLYESLIHPLTILLSLPSASVGALLFMLLFGQQLTIVSVIGIILLIGIVKKNAIMMIDFALDAERNEGLSPEEAIYKACVIRFRPIMMTTTAALFGAVPLAIGFGAGSELRQPLGIAVIGGLLFSQPITLLSTPVIYLAFEHLRAWMGFKQAKKVVEPAAAF